MHDRYHAFIDVRATISVYSLCVPLELISNLPVQLLSCVQTSILFPTLGINLGWHTHQLKTRQDGADVIKFTGTFAGSF